MPSIKKKKRNGHLINPKKTSITSAGGGRKTSKQATIAQAIPTSKIIELNTIAITLIITLIFDFLFLLDFMDV